MIGLVDLEHERLRSNPTLWRFFSCKTLAAKRRIEDLSGQSCAVIRYHEVNPSVLEGLNLAAVVVGGNYTGFQHFSEYDLAGLKEVFRKATRPIFAICGGFQLLAQVYGGGLGPIDPATAEAENAPEGTDTPYPPELLPSNAEMDPSSSVFERGFMPVRVVRTHPLFEGLAAEAIVYQLHGGEVKGLPAGFLRLAESDLCRIQAIAHRTLLLFGVQFHPERYDENHQDGRRILQNFFRIAGGP
jgi:GMP synthase-like glutamine amidotransferase